jgi:hypothetical protein
MRVGEFGPKKNGGQTDLQRPENEEPRGCWREDRTEPEATTGADLYSSELRREKLASSFADFSFSVSWRIAL